MQVLLFTATMPEAVATAAAKWCRKAVSCAVEGEGVGASISSTVTQVRVAQLCCKLLAFYFTFRTTARRLMARALRPDAVHRPSLQKISSMLLYSCDGATTVEDDTQWCRLPTYLLL